MANLKLQLSDSITNNFGNKIAPWAGNYSRAKTWKLPSDTATGWGGSLYQIALNKWTIYAQYGSNNPDGYWASIRMYDIDYTISNEVQNADGSISATLTMNGGVTHSVRTDYFVAGLQVQYTFYINGNQVASWSGGTGDNLNVNLSPHSETVTLAPSTSSEIMELHIHIHYPNGEAADSDLYVGGKITNPNPPTYIPMSIRKTAAWKSLNLNNGFIHIRHSGVWIDKSKENSSTIMNTNAGHNRIRKNGNWQQLPPMK
ncbi:hypothetical protein [Lactococcus allomyrinae]|uniref:Uncharacterized protein n=1 Tax=Lactococcus allomyrinae TaxID=2419773 RepID=A0A387BKZ9_9LACT|nr:hypothetical protein [Lactococcus allomyrinae]AYG01717.1 hypothetical protein D7I46_12020 [Lactococcus allomyrinae]